MKSWMNPKWRALTFLILVNLAWIGAAWAWTERSAWLWIMPIALSINFLLLTYDQVLSFSMLESRPLLGQDAWGLLKIVHRLSQRFEIPEPSVHVIVHPSAQVFAYGRSRKRTRLFVTEGVLKLLNAQELEAVLTFEILSIDRELPILNYWVAAILDLKFRFGKMIERALTFVFGWSPALSVWFTRPASWFLHSLLLSRADIQKIDHRAATMIGNPEDLARALWKMESYAHTKPWSESWVFAHMCIVSPLPHWLGSQPPLKRRIKGLLGRYPL